MAPPPTTTIATQGDGTPKIGKQDLSIISNQDLGQRFNKSNSTVHAMGLSNPDTEEQPDKNTNENKIGIFTKIIEKKIDPSPLPPRGNPPLTIDKDALIGPLPPGGDPTPLKQECNSVWGGVHGWIIRGALYEC